MNDTLDFQSYTNELKEKIQTWGGDLIGIKTEVR